MQNLFDTATYNSVVERMNNLTYQTQRQWGKMDAAQILAHCKEAFKVPLSEKPMPRMLLGILLGWALKSKLYNEEPWKKNLPTAPSFIIKDQRDFNKEKQELMEMIHTFYTKGPGQVGKFPHPMFGTFTQEQWGKAMFKHIDHHLQQFEV